MPTKAHTNGTFGKLMAALSLVLLIVSPSVLGRSAAAETTAPYTSATSRGTALVALLAAAPGGTFQDFDVPNTGTPYVLGVHEPPRAPIPIDGGPTGKGKMLRLAFGTPPISHNSIAFQRSNAGLFDQVVADFDFRITPGNGRADGLGFALLNTADYGITGTVAPHLSPFVAEEPNFTGSLGIGFDVYRSKSPLEINNNHISVHFNGQILKEFDVGPALDLAVSEWSHARILMRSGGDNSDVTVILAQCGRMPVTVVDHFKILLAN
jgi:hypothetical protein